MRLISSEPIAAALKECAGLLFKEFALVVLNENGEEDVYTSAALTPHQRRIFTDRFKVDFHSSVRKAHARGSCLITDSIIFPVHAIRC